MRLKHQDSRYYRKWKWMAPLGLSLIGLGLSLTGEATLLKFQDAVWWIWAGMGTLGLIVVNSGISVFGDALKRRFWMEWAEQTEQKQTEDGA